MVATRDIRDETLQEIRFRVFNSLSQLVEIYLPRAMNKEAVQKTSPKDALAIVKSSLELMDALSSNKLLATPSAVASQRHRSIPRPEYVHADIPVAEILPRLVESAVQEIAFSDEDTRQLEPWARLLIRCDSLLKKLQNQLTRIEEARLPRNNSDVGVQNQRRNQQKMKAKTYPEGEAVKLSPQEMPTSKSEPKADTQSLDEKTNPTSLISDTENNQSEHKENDGKQIKPRAP